MGIKSTFINSSELLDLAQCRDPRDFLKKILLLHYRSKGRLNLSEFSRRCGFSSRSFLNEYLNGKKKLSKDSLFKIRDALKFFKSPISKKFEILVFLDQAELRNQFMQTDSLNDQLSKLQSIMISDASNSSKVDKPDDVENIIRKLHLFKIFASVGSLERGATVSEILAKTNIGTQKLLDALDFLVERKALRKIENRYLANNRRFDFLNFKNTEALVELCTEFCLELQKSAKKTISDENNAFFYSAFSIPKKHLPNLKKELQTQMLEIIDRYQDDSGEHVQQVFLCSKGV